MRNSLIISIAMSVFMIVGCGTISNAIVKPTKTSTKLPDKNAIKSIDIISDSASAMAYDPNNEASTISQILSWLHTAGAVEVQFPKVNVQTGPSGGNTGPAILELDLKDGESVGVLPAFYLVPAKHGYAYRYLDGIVEYKNSWDGTNVYLKSPSLYTWLKQDHWKNEFHMSGQNH